MVAGRASAGGFNGSIAGSRLLPRIVLRIILQAADRFPQVSNASDEMNWPVWVKQ